ncbi:hypothetical protein JX266_013778 [Neoarthrinium moseri]|nr:hypothetical protein JX266_013778 [Neoarthrinium moseri]
MPIQRLENNTDVFTLGSDHMGDNLTSSLSILVADDMFTGKIHVGDLNIDWLGFVRAVKLPKRHDYAAVRYETFDEDGVARLFRCLPSEVIALDFTKSIERPS